MNNVISSLVARKLISRQYITVIHQDQITQPTDIYSLGERDRHYDNSTWECVQGT